MSRLEIRVGTLDRKVAFKKQFNTGKDDRRIGIALRAFGSSDGPERSSVSIGSEYRDRYHAGYGDGSGPGEKEVTRESYLSLSGDIVLKAVIALLLDKDFSIDSESSSSLLSAHAQALERSLNKSTMA
jgi:hypothetical protein